MSKQQWVSRYAGIALSVLVAAGCGDAGKDEAESAPATSGPATAAPVRTASAPADACGWIPAAEAAAIVGPLEGAPVIVRSQERPDPDASGAACRYGLATKPRVGRGAVVLQVDLSGGIIEERVGGNMTEGFRQIIQAGTSAAGSPAPAADPPPPGWDRVGKLWIGFNTFTGRIGHVAVSAMALTPEVPSEKTAALATRVRDALPDLPFRLPRDPQLEAFARAAGEPLDAEPSGPDPCALLSAEQAEQVLGKLVVPPYRSAGDSPLAVRNGTSCSYFTAGHRALTIKPHWDSGKMIFGMAKGVGGVVGSVAPDDTAAAADTLEGPWEEAAANGTTGQLYFLKGDRMLEVGYVTSSTDRAGAVRLARSAVEKL
jgi:hypothetical protein